MGRSLGRGATGRRRALGLEAWYAQGRVERSRVRHCLGVWVGGWGGRSGPASLKATFGEEPRQRAQQSNRAGGKATLERLPFLSILFYFPAPRRPSSDQLMRPRACCRQEFISLISRLLQGLWRAACQSSAGTVALTPRSLSSNLGLTVDRVCNAQHHLLRFHLLGPAGRSDHLSSDRLLVTCSPTSVQFACPCSADGLKCVLLPFLSLSLPPLQLVCSPLRWICSGRQGVGREAKSDVRRQREWAGSPSSP